MHTFYFSIVNDPKNSKSQADRINRLEELIKIHEMKCHKETFKDVTTLQIETQNKANAIMFKLAAETAMHCEHN